MSNSINKIKVKFYLGEKENDLDLEAGFEKSRAQSTEEISIVKGARGAEALVAGFEKSRAQSKYARFEKSHTQSTEEISIDKGARGAEALVAGFDTEFKKSYTQTTYVKLDLEAQTTYMDDNETICDPNVNTFTKLFRVLCDLF